MIWYRVYILGEGGHVIDRRDIHCEDDNAAKEQAKQMVDGHAVELWHEARKIAEFALKD